MYHNTDACQLSQSEKRILAEAELLSQRKRLHELRRECMDAERRIQMAMQVLMEVDCALV